MARGRVEARITVPTGGWSVSLTITAIGGPYTVTVAAGNYFPTDLLSTLQTQLDAATGGDGAFTVSASWGEAGTGLVTIAHATQTFTLTWTSVPDGRPALNITSKVLLTWPVSGGNWVLEAADSLPAVDWTPVAATPMSVDGQPAVLLEPAAASKVYRLRKAP